MQGEKKTKRALFHHWWET